MIVYGTRAPLQKTEHIYESCPNCGKTNTLLMSVYQRYAHIFWIPVFPAGKTGISLCQNCGQQLKLKQMPDTLRLSYENVKAQTRVPLWTFSGAALLAILITWVVIHGQQQAERVSKLVLAPKANDVFHVKLKENEYVLYKVLKVERDSVFFIASKYQTNQESDLDNVAVKGYDDSTSYGISKAKLASMQKNDEILDIERN